MRRSLSDREVQKVLKSPLGQRAADEGWLPHLRDELMKGETAFDEVVIDYLRARSAESRAYLDAQLARSDADIGGGNIGVGQAMKAMIRSRIADNEAFMRKYQSRQLHLV